MHVDEWEETEYEHRWRNFGYWTSSREVREKSNMVGGGGVVGWGGGQGGLLAVQYLKIIEAEFYNYFYKFAKLISRFCAEYWLVGEFFVDTFE